MSDKDSDNSKQIGEKTDSPSVPSPSDTSPSAQSSRVSAWSYVKWLIWTAISEAFGCGSAITDGGIDDFQQFVVGGEQQLNVEQNHNCVDHSTTKISQIVNTQSKTTVTSIEHSSNNLLEENLIWWSTLDTYTSNEAAISEVYPVVGGPPDCVKTPVYHNPLSVSPKDSLKLLADSIPNCSDKHVWRTSSLSELETYTVLSAYKSDASNGVIDDETHALFVQHVLASVIPRNLSDTSESGVDPYIRKMYAWQSSPHEPDSIDILQQEEEEEMQKGTSQPPQKLDLVADSCAAAIPNVDPDDRASSSASFSPTVCSTVGSDTPSTEMTDEDINTGADRLVWAMNKMRVDDTAKMFDIEDDLRTLEGEATPKKSEPFSVTIQNADDNHSQRSRSRSRSPVPTHLQLPSSPSKQSKLTDSLSLPLFAPLEGSDAYDVRSPLYSDSEFTIPKAKRSSSLKTQRTPPDTPARKAVRFADAFGLDLATVRHVFDSEAPPKIPASAIVDLELDSDESIAKIGAKQFRICFPQPGSASSFIRRVLAQTVCLEDAHVDMPRGVLTGTIRVRSLGYEKRVYIRITYNNWITHFDTQASYVQGSHDGATDRFSFSVIFPDNLVPGDRAQFAVRYETHTGEQFWDNNCGQNYVVTCYAKATDMAGDGSWLHYL